MARRGTNVQRAQSEEERPPRWVLEGIPVLIAKDFSDSQEPNPRPMATLEGEASRDISELAKQIRRCCSNKKWTSYQKRVACQQLVKLAFLSTDSISRLVEEFPEPFREIKLRAAPGRKTFSTKTWVNKFLIKHIVGIHELAREEAERDPGCDYNFESDFRYVAEHVPLTRQNAKQWLDAIWKLLLTEIPNPEGHPRLRQLGRRPSLRTKRMRSDGTVGEKTQAHNIRAAIKAKLGVYLKRMLNDSTVHK